MYKDYKISKINTCTKEILKSHAVKIVCLMLSCERIFGYYVWRKRVDDRLAFIKHKFQK